MQSLLINDTPTGGQCSILLAAFGPNVVDGLVVGNTSSQPLFKQFCHVCCLLLCSFLIVVSYTAPTDPTIPGGTPPFTASLLPFTLPLILPLCRDIRLLILEHCRWSVIQKYQAVMKGLTVDDLMAFVSGFKAELYTEGLVQGNFTSEVRNTRRQTFTVILLIFT